MNRILIEIDIRNNAFRDGHNTELTRILLELAEDIQDHGPHDKLLKDINGNSVGEMMTDHTPVFI